MRRSLSDGSGSDMNEDMNFREQLSQYTEGVDGSAEEFLKSAAERLENCALDLKETFVDLKGTIDQMKIEGVAVPEFLESMAETLSSFADSTSRSDLVEQGDQDSRYKIKKAHDSSAIAVNSDDE